MNVLLIQLPIPRLELGRQTGSIPLGAACLAEAAADIPGANVTLVPESRAAFLGDAALAGILAASAPDVVGFSVYCWNVKRALYLAEQVKSACGAKIVFGGPEVTPDNPTVRSDVVDAYVCGEGEAVFRDLVDGGVPGGRPVLSAPAGALFTRRPSPYLSGRLEPGIENLMMLETQRGCPYRCGYCYYNKAVDGRSVVDVDLVLDGVRWAVNQGMGELFFIDPSLNARPALPAFLDSVAAINHDRTVRLLSEIRAEAITPSLADRFAAAGFTWFEIGLQSTNPRAQEAMNRTTRREAFLDGVAQLKSRGITPGIDLIAGLPEDDLAGFKASVDFMAHHGLTDDVQVFPLSILPGTDFRRRSAALGLRFDPEPPYTVIGSSRFSEADMVSALAYAEAALGTVLYPWPDLNLHYHRRRAHPPDGHYRPAAMPDGISKLILKHPCTMSDLTAAARRLTHPYQVFVWPPASAAAFLAEAIQRITALNPFTPLEMVFMGCRPPGGVRALLDAARLHRPHYLDLDLRYMLPKPGNRAIMVTEVSVDIGRRSGETIHRRVHWWRRDRLPEESDLTALEHWDGVLIDVAGGDADGAVEAWQRRFAAAGDLPAIAFGDADQHRRWVSLTAGGAYHIPML